MPHQVLPALQLHAELLDAQVLIQLLLQLREDPPDASAAVAVLLAGQNKQPSYLLPQFFHPLHSVLKVLSDLFLESLVANLYLQLLHQGCLQVQIAL